jgi:hypothetical protein
VPRPEQSFDLANGVQGAAFRAVGVLFRLQVGLEDRLQDQHSSHLYHAIFYARNSERPELAVPFGDEHASDRPGAIRSVPELFRQFVQPLVSSVRLDVRETLAVDTRRTVVLTTADECPLQDVSTIQLVVQRVEPVVRRVLRFGVQRRL